MDCNEMEYKCLLYCLNIYNKTKQNIHSIVWKKDRKEQVITFQFLFYLCFKYIILNRVKFERRK